MFTSDFGAADFAPATVSAMLLSGFAAAALARATSARMLSGFRNGLFLALARASSARMSSDFGIAGLGSTLAASAVLPSAFTASGAGISAAGTTEGASLTDSVGSILGDSSLAMACGPDGKIHPSVTFRNYQLVTGFLRRRGKITSTLQESVTTTFRANRRSRAV